MLYSNNWDVSDFSGFFLICVGYTFAFLPLPAGTVLLKPDEINGLSIETRS
jgi:hypothetical protein